ncbi:hypothetical protein AVEN_40266-1 [Araneus ventricosus]|uniref:Uncharacterized protein n=1 Tax=Araneus ventricosus TaxID=182803 RepID=A0A4Y2MHD1_ARAVE|nr:hypothetical protein AVEN_40266-1 [Araneus ventricosus]
MRLFSHLSGNNPISRIMENDTLFPNIQERRNAGASEKSPNNVEFCQISYNHSLDDLAGVWFTIGDISARLTENRFALGNLAVHNLRHLRPADGTWRHLCQIGSLGDLARVWFTIGPSAIPS